MPNGCWKAISTSVAMSSRKGRTASSSVITARVKRNPVFHLTAITRRRDALFQTSTIGGKWLARTDTAQLNGVRTEVMVWRALETAVREPVAVYATTSSGGMYHAARRAAPARARRGTKRHRRVLRRAHQRQKRVRGRSRHRHLLRRADGLGAGDAISGRSRSHGDGRHAHASRSILR